MASIPIIEAREKTTRILAWILREERHVAEIWRAVEDSLALRTKVDLVFATSL
jgi:hypothetical protein